MTRWLAILVLALVMSVGAGCAPTVAVSPNATKTQTPLITVAASAATTTATDIVSWQIFPYQNGKTTGFTIMGLDASKKMLRASRVFKVAGKTSASPTTIAFAPLYPKVKGRVRVLDNGLFGEATLSQKNFTKYFRWMRSDLSNHLDANSTKTSKSLTNGQRALTCLEAPSQITGLVRHQTRLCGLAVHAMFASASTVTPKTLHILGDDDDDTSAASGDDDTSTTDNSASNTDTSNDTSSDNVVDTSAADDQAQGDTQDSSQDSTQDTTSDDGATDGAQNDDAAQFTPIEDSSDNSGGETAQADSAQPPAEATRSIASGVDDTTAKTADDPSQPTPTETEKAPAATADTKALGADPTTAACADCSSGMKSVMATAQLLNSQRTPDYYSATVSLSGLGLSGELSIAITKDGTIYASGGINGNGSALNAAPSFSGSASANWMIAGKADEGFMTGETNNVSAAAGIVTVNHAQNPSGESVGIGFGPGFGVMAGKSYGVNLLDGMKAVANAGMQDGNMVGLMY